MRIQVSSTPAAPPTAATTSSTSTSVTAGTAATSTGALSRSAVRTTLPFRQRVHGPKELGGDDAPELHRGLVAAELIRVFDDRGPHRIRAGGIVEARQAASVSQGTAIGEASQIALHLTDVDPADVTSHRPVDVVPGRRTTGGDAIAATRKLVTSDDRRAVGVRSRSASVAGAAQYPPKEAQK